jgi:hypothetical protein
MDIRELRIGNLYDNNGNYFVVTPNTIESLFERERVWCKPIPLTEEILLKCGFEKFNTIGGCFYYINGLRIDYILCKFVLLGYDRCNLNYLHELQNIYSCLCGDELKINL